MIRSLLTVCLALSPIAATAQVAVGAKTLTTQQAGTAIDSLATRAKTLPADRRASLVAPMRALGPSAVDAMIARLGSDSAVMQELKLSSLAAHDAFIAALLDALGAFRSPRAEPTFKRLFESAEASDLVSRMAAEGLGRLCTTSSLQTLATHANSADARALAAANGLGLCRNESSATALSTWLGTNPPEQTTRAVALALGMLGSSWAWDALGPTRAEEGRQIRSTIAPALLAAYPRAQGEVAKAIIAALLMVDDSATSSAIEQLPANDVLRSRWAKAHQK